MSRLSFCLLSALAGATPLACAQFQAPPSGGQLLREAQAAQRPPARDSEAALPGLEASPPEASLSGGPRMRLKAVRIVGAQTQSVDRLQALLADAVGQELDLSGLQALADRITAHYRAQGYALARAWLPAQEIRDGEVEITVVEACLDKLNLRVAEGLPTEGVRARLGHLREGEPLMSSALEGDLLALSDVPGVRVQTVLRPGESMGTSELDIEVMPGERLSGVVGLDNLGNRSTGELRGTASLRVASPFLFGDALEASAAYAGRGLGYLRVAWQAPWGAAGWDIGVAQSLMHYRLGGEFASLQARGSASDSTLYAIKSLQRRRDGRLRLELAFDRKRYDDEANGALAVKRVDALAVSVSGDRQAGEGSAWGSAGVVAGRLRLDPANVEADAQGHRTAGSYARLVLQGGGERALADGLAGSLRANAQWAAKNLDSSEKLALGGLQGVRAYPQGEASSDDALILSAELRWSLGAWRALVFADAAQGRLWHRGLPAERAVRKTLHGVGAGAELSLPQRVLLQLTVAQPTAGPPARRADRGARAWLQLGKAF
jgi:hemolysin activation/secretion protein